MKTLFLAISSSYSHSLLAPRYLAANSPLPVTIHETNINVPIEKNLEVIKNFNPDVIAFSCYIFNIIYIEKILEELKKILPDVITILGGYEAAFRAEELIEKCSFVLKGEGDFSFGKLLSDIAENKIYAPLVIESGTVKCLDDIKSPYTEEYLSLAKSNHMIYMETCRGCPFGCSYCMSANTRGVRSFSDGRVFSDFAEIMKFEPKVVKLVDRTFNYDKMRAARIFAHLIENYGTSKTRFHFEMAPELFDENLFEVLQKAPEGLFQFEIGIQSYKSETLKAVKRHADCEIIDKNIKRLVRLGNIEIHTDLIAGLPEETKEDFIIGFNRLVRLRPHKVQAGFLKILKGSEIADNSDGYVISDFPPYEIVSSPKMTKEDLQELKKAESMLNLYYNSGRFKQSMDFLIEQFPPYKLFLSLNDFYEEKNAIRNISAKAHCDMLYEFGLKYLSPDNAKTLELCIYHDYINSGNVRKWHKWLAKNRS